MSSSSREEKGLAAQGLAQGVQRFAGEVRDEAKGIGGLWARCARHGFTNLFGKLDDLGHLRVPSETGRLIRDRAAAVGMPVGEYLRECIELGFHGREEIERRHTVRLDGLVVVGRKRDGNAPKE